MTKSKTIRLTAEQEIDMIQELLLETIDDVHYLLETNQKKQDELAVKKVIEGGQCDELPQGTEVKILYAENVVEKTIKDGLIKVLLTEYMTAIQKDLSDRVREGKISINSSNGYLKSTQDDFIDIVLRPENYLMETHVCKKLH